MQPISLSRPRHRWDRQRPDLDRSVNSLTRKHVQIRGEATRGSERVRTDSEGLEVEPRTMIGTKRDAVIRYLKLGFGGAQTELNHWLIYTPACASPQ